MPRALVSIGSNLGDSVAAVEEAGRALRALSRPGSFAASSRWMTAPVGGPPGQGPFVNAAAVLETSLEPAELLQELQRIERALERARHERWGPRTLDLDLLLVERIEVRTDELRLPHPRMTFRKFVLAPAVEVAGDWTHPEAGVTLDRLLQTLLNGPAELTVVGDATGDVSSEATRAAAGRFAVARSPALPDPPPRLTIDARRAAPCEPFGGPRLALEDCPSEHWRDEVRAAIECVWPSAPANAVTPLAAPPLP